jgi:cob(I)alamin adenosyltransferase
MKIYTKTGDKGQTSLLGGTRVSKGYIRIEAYGTVDELNAHLGMLRDVCTDEEVKDQLLEIQQTLFVVGSWLACEQGEPAYPLPEMPSGAAGLLETAIDAMNEALPPMRNFILPGGHPTVSWCHIARTVCRRAERACIRLAEQETVNQDILIYLNRLSDFLFVLSRWLTQQLGAPEIPWKTS